jgi:ribA/ribD-fused uncharacterized protein
MAIDTFYENGVHLPLSNFYPSPFRANGWHVGVVEEYATVEHYYQAAKATDLTEVERIRLTSTPGKAKRLGRGVALSPFWETEKLHVMRYALSRKFTPSSELAAYLLSTGDQLLTEGNSWGDSFWGAVDGQGANWLGHLLMARRAELRAT